MANNKVYGIDLGTTYSCIAHVDEHGKPTVEANAEGDLTTPSVVYFESADNIVVGTAAKEIAEVYPNQVVSTVKRVMGDPDWEFENEGSIYTPQDISAFIIKKVVKDAEDTTGDQITDVVITVPAYFGVNEKEATKQAGQIAGLNVLYVIPEPTAAAISYGVEQAEDEVVLVYDLGGGTFDITVIEIKDGNITVICTGGNHSLGGRDWDEVLASYFAEEFANSTGCSVDDIMDDAEAWQELLNIAESSKKTLSTREKATQRISFDGEKETIEITRDKFNEITANLIGETISKTEELIQTASKKGYDKIDKLLLVGGSTYMPQVRSNLESKYNFDIQIFDPNQSVAKGAALYGYKEYLIGELAKEVGTDELDQAKPEERKEAVARLSGRTGKTVEEINKVIDAEIINVTSKSFGVVVSDNGDLQVQNMIMVNDHVPATAIQTFGTLMDNQESVDVRCMENVVPKGKDDETIPLDTSTEVGSAELIFPYALPENSPIEIAFSLSADGLLKVTAKDLTANSDLDIKFKTESILSDKEIEQKKSHAQAMRVT